MASALNLTVRNPVEVMGLVASFFSGTPRVEITFEGDVSAIDWAAIPGATLHEGHCSVVVPLNHETLEALSVSVFPRVGLRSRVWHVVVRQGDQRLFASYDNFGAAMVVVEAPERERLCSQLRAAGLVIDERIVMYS